ncbi:uncharacterized protein LOC128884185 [Hylaeus volcanicus]|uniref:uncharacterized protein LOC128884185 n=1 Tax=Hylaeus volcanicus TaxID=313075 RepID=UPI0023B81694|nr:uncharacterized protein LOC128884185 [Hylaeus volcanicus]
MSNQHDIKKSFKPDGIKITDAYQESHAHKKTLHDDVKGTPNTSLMESPRQNEKHFMDLNANKFFSPPIDPLSSLALPKESNSSEMKSNPASTPSNDNESHLSQINETEAYHTKLIDPQTHFVHRFNSIDDASQKEQNTITDKMNFSEKEPHSLPFAQKFSKQTTLSINSCHNIYTSQIRPFHSYAFDESSFSSIDQFRLPRKGLKTSLMSQSSESSSCDLIKNYPYTKFLLEDLHNYTATLDWHHVYLYLSSKRGLEKNTA